MLILGRKIGETIRIGDEVEVTLLSVKGLQVRLGINAPTEIPVHRGEIYQQILDDRMEEEEGKTDQNV